ncbi:MAG: AbrB/MazE/SpoVT family DNA-binding domain-containing protein [Lachnospiraceae bacterium]|nr:AbrB/MazE/SpoVT family DNA-binding domain-containing protein [Lachnospiraceae bacterium]
MSTKRIRKSGAIAIPIAMRRNLNIQPNDAVDVMEIDGNIVLKPSAPRCQFCSTQEELISIKGKYICEACITEAGKAVREK